MKSVRADDGPPVDSQRHLDQQEGQEAPEEEERVELAEDRVQLVVTVNNIKEIPLMTQKLKKSSLFLPDVEHAGGGLGQDQAGVDQVGDGEEDDEDRGGVGPDGLGAEEDIQGGDVEDSP